jgi:hypothetical protein
MQRIKNGKIDSMSQKQLRQKVEQRDLPLEYGLDVTEAGGIYAFRSSIRRGVLCLTLQHRVGPQGVIDEPDLPVHADFELLARVLRVALQKAGLPSDREYVWISVAGGEWRHDENHEEDLEGQPYELRSWHDQLVAMTEPLSQYRLIGDLLHQIDQLLRLNLQPHALEIYRALIKAYWRFRVGVSDVNRLADRGMISERCLAKGPETRKTRGTVVLEIVCKHADRFWSRRAALRGNKTITAEEIALEVNEELKSLGQRPLRPKTIADTISKGISGGILRTG